MAFPSVVGTPTESAAATDDTSPFTISRPAGVSGQMTIAILAVDGNPTIGWPAGYESLFQVTRADGFSLHAAYHHEDGTEGSTFDVTSNAAEKWAAIVYSISGAAWPDTPEGTSVDGGAGTTQSIDPPSFSPTGGAKDYLWIACGAQDGEEADDDTWITSTFSGFTDPARQKTSGTGGAAATNVSLCSAERQENTATKDPAAATAAVAHTYVAATIVLHPGGPAAQTLTPSPIAAATATPTPTVYVVPPTQTLTPDPVAATPDIPEPLRWGRYPTILWRNWSPGGAANVNHYIVLPSIVRAHELLVVIFGGAPSVTTPPNGWTQVGQQANGVSVQVSCYVRDADGTEGGTQPNFVTADVVTRPWVAFRIARWRDATHLVGDLTLDFVLATTTGTVVSADPPSATNWGAGAHTLWVAGAANGPAATNVGGPPSGYDNYTSTSGNGYGMASGTREIDGATEDPTTFTNNPAGTPWVAFTFGVCEVSVPQTLTPSATATATATPTPTVGIAAPQTLTPTPVAVTLAVPAPDVGWHIRLPTAPTGGYSIPGGATYVTTSAELKTALASGTRLDIKLADGTYTDTAAFVNNVGHSLYAENLGGAIFTAGISLGANWATYPATIQGLAFDVTGGANCPLGSAINIWGVGGDGHTIRDCTFDGNSTAYAGILAQKGEGLTIERVYAHHFTDFGIYVQQSPQVTVAAILNDLDAEYVARSTPGSGGGTCEAGIWVGVRATVRRIRSRYCGWMDLWTGGLCDGSSFEDVTLYEAEGNVQRYGWYLEHDTTNTTMRYFDIHDVRVGITCEWNGGSGDGASVDVTVEWGTIESVTAGVYMDQGTTRMAVNHVTFTGQWWAAIGDYLGVNNTYSNNDYSGIRTDVGAVETTTAHLPDYGSFIPFPSAAVTAVPTPTIEATTRTLTPDPATTATAVPTPTLQVIGPTQTLTPSPVAATTATTAQTIGFIKTVTPTPSAAVTDVPIPSLGVAGVPQNLAPAPTATTTTVTNVVLTFLKTITPTPPTVTTAIAAPTLGQPLPMGTSRVEVHDPVTHALIDILDRAYKVSYDLQVNAAPIASFYLPRDDPKWAAIVPFYEVWIYNELNELIDVFRIAPIQERRTADGTIAQVRLEGYACALQDDIIPAEYIWTNQTVTQVLTDILAYQTTARITLGTVDASLNKTITTRAAYENLMRAAWETRNIVGGFISVDANPSNPALRTLNLRADPGQDIGQRVTTGWNLRQISKSTESQGIVTKVWALGRGEGVYQLRLSTDKLLAEPMTFALHAGGRSTLTITRDFARYKGWVTAGAALPDGYDAARDVRVRPMKVWRGAVDETANFEQGASERELRSKTNDYNPGAGAWTIDYVHADYLQADAQVATYGILSNVYVNKNLENSAALLLEAVRYLDSVKSPRVSHEIAVADLARVYRSETFERLHLYDKVNVWDDALDIVTKDRIVGLTYGDIDDPSTMKITVSTLSLADQTPRAVDVRDRVRKYEQEPDGAITLLGPDSFEDNVDATHPYTRYIEIPSSAVSVISVKLRMRTRPYRKYEAGASSTDNSQASSSSTTGEESYHNHMVQLSPNNTGGASTGQTGNQNATHNHSDPQGGSTGYEGQNHAHDMYHTHGYNMSSSVTDAGSSHTHGMAHTHQHGHTITLTAGIYEGGTATSVQVLVDGTVASATATTLDDFDLVPYLSKNSDGTIQRGYHTFVFTPNNVGRIQATISGLLFLQSRGAISG